MHNDKESPFTLTLLEGDLTLQAVRFKGSEGLNQLYRFEIEVIAMAPAMDFGRLLRKPVFLDLGNGDGIHGSVHSATREHHGSLQIGYTLTVVPYLQRLESDSCRRVFHHLDVPTILRQLLEQNELPEESYRIELNGQYPPRPFCIQYEESDLALLQRLCEEEGIHFHFEHHRNGHVLVLADDGLSFPQDPRLTPFQQKGDDLNGASAITRLYQRHDALHTHAQRQAKNRGIPDTLGDAANHAFAKASRTAVLSTPEQVHHQQCSQRQLERLRCTPQQIHGESTQPALRSARIVQISEHPIMSFNDQWLLTEIRHHGQYPSILAQDGIAASYHNQFTAIPWSTVFRPPVTRTKTRIPGYQPARVLGCPGQPATRDDQGRVQVRLWPTSEPDPEEPDGMWVPIVCATPDAHSNLVGLPKAGTDVFVSFLDSDPDRPVMWAGSRQSRQSKPEPRHGGNTGLLFDWLINR